MLLTIVLRAIALALALEALVDLLTNVKVKCEVRK